MSKTRGKCKYLGTSAQGPAETKRGTKVAEAEWVPAVRNQSRFPVDESAGVQQRDCASRTGKSEALSMMGLRLSLMA